MDISADGVLNLADWRVWMLKPDVAYRAALDNLFRSAQWNAPEQARQAIEEHYRLILEVRRKSKAKGLDDARQQEQELLTSSYEELVARLARLQQGGVRNAKLRRRLTADEVVAFTRVARQPRILRIAVRLADMSKGHGSQWVHDVPRWKEFAALRPAEREIVIRLLPFILGFRTADRQRSKVAPFIAQFLCGLAIDINASVNTDAPVRRAKIPKGWYSPDYAAKIVRTGDAESDARRCR